MTYVLIAVFASTLGFLEARMLNAPVLLELGMGIGMGVVWTAIAYGVSRLLERFRENPVNAPNGSAIAVALCATMLLTPGILLELMMFPSPDAYLSMIESAGNGTVGFYATFNPLNEWVLVPLALFFNWRSPIRRRIAIVAAVLYYLERVATYLYFAPAVLRWQASPKSAELVQQVGNWLSVDWSRMAVDGLMIVLFVAITFFPGPVGRISVRVGEAASVPS